MNSTTQVDAEAVPNALHNGGLELVDHIPQHGDLDLVRQSGAASGQQSLAYSQSNKPSWGSPFQVLDILSPIEYYSPIKDLLTERVAPLQRRAFTLIYYSILLCIFTIFCAINMSSCTTIYSVSRGVNKASSAFNKCVPLVYVGSDLTPYGQSVATSQDSGKSLNLVGTNLYFADVDTCVTSLRKIFLDVVSSTSSGRYCIARECQFELPFCDSQPIACAGANTWPPTPEPTAKPTPSPFVSPTTHVSSSISSGPNEPSWNGAGYKTCEQNLIFVQLSIDSAGSTGACNSDILEGQGSYVPLNSSYVPILFQKFLKKAASNDGLIPRICQDIYQRGAPYQCSMTTCPSFPQAAGIASGWTSLFSGALLLLSKSFLKEIAGLLPCPQMRK